MKKTSPEWLHWIEASVNQGIAQQTLIDILIANEFDADTANQMVLAKAAQCPAPDADSDTGPKIATSPYVYEDGDFYPGTTVKTLDREIRVLMKIDKPRVALFGNVLSKAECDFLITLGKPKLERSTVIDHASGDQLVDADRTSTGGFFNIRENQFIATIERRFAELMHAPAENGEGLQFLHYQPGTEYKPHFDYFTSASGSIARHIAVGGQRTATLIVYLNTVELGGETILPELGLEIAPVQGNALYFSYCDINGQLDPLTHHGGKPVLQGEKWAVTKWSRQRSLA